MRFERSARPEGSRDAGGRKVELGQKLKDLQERARQLGYRLVIQRRGMEASGRERNGAEWTEAEPVSGSEPFRNGQAPVR